MKKNSSKPAAKSPAPATKTSSAKPAAATKPAPAAKPVAKPAAKPVAPAKAAKPAAKKKTVASVPPVAAPVPEVKAVEIKPVVTTVTAKIDIGFGNSLYVRGEGAGLSWDKGLLMECVSDDQWQIALGESSRPIVFKFLVNDLSWSVGEDYTVTAGSSVTLVPTF